jgi:hypothetical protein
MIDLETSTGRNLFLVSKNGEKKQITFLEGFPEGGFMDFSWSPDGSLIAFWILTAQVNGLTPYAYDLAILDTKTSTIQSLCIPAYFYREVYPKWYPIWNQSSDGLVVATQNETNPYVSEIVVVDLESNNAYRIAEDAIPLGWLISD